MSYNSSNNIHLNVVFITIELYICTLPYQSINLFLEKTITYNFVDYVNEMRVGVRNPNIYSSFYRT